MQLWQSSWISFTFPLWGIIEAGQGFKNGVSSFWTATRMGLYYLRKEHIKWALGLHRLYPSRAFSNHGTRKRLIVSLSRKKGDQGVGTPWQLGFGGMKPGRKELWRSPKDLCKNSPVFNELLYYTYTCSETLKYLAETKPNQTTRSRDFKEIFDLRWSQHTSLSRLLKGYALVMITVL